MADGGIALEVDPGHVEAGVGEVLEILAKDYGSESIPVCVNVVGGACGNTIGSILARNRIQVTNVTVRNVTSCTRVERMVCQLRISTVLTVMEMHFAFGSRAAEPMHRKQMGGNSQWKQSKRD